MAQITAYEDIAPEHVIRHRGSGPDHPSADVYPFIGRPREAGGANAFLVRYLPGSVSSAHYHAADQMQIVVEGRGRLGRHELTPFQVHFSRAYTPYGPLLPDRAEGWAFVNLRTRPDPGGAQRLPGARGPLLGMDGRRPFQVTCAVDFPPAGDAPALRPIPGLSNGEGLAGWAWALPPHGRAAAPSAAGSDGQYVLVVRGSLVADGRARHALAIAHVGPHEAPFMIEAGPGGLQAMVLNFPRVAAEAAPPRPPAADVAAAADGAWSCRLCDFVYDEAQGLPEEGIPPGTRWAEVPEAWTCPDCGATKADFTRVEF